VNCSLLAQEETPAMRQREAGQRPAPAAGPPAAGAVQRPLIRRCSGGRMSTRPNRQPVRIVVHPLSAKTENMSLEIYAFTRTARGAWRCSVFEYG